MEFALRHVRPADQSHRFIWLEEGCSRARNLLDDAAYYDETADVADRNRSPFLDLLPCLYDDEEDEEKDERMDSGPTSWPKNWWNRRWKGKRPVRRKGPSEPISVKYVIPFTMVKPSRIVVTKRYRQKVRVPVFSIKDELRAFRPELGNKLALAVLDSLTRPTPMKAAA